MSEIKDAIEEEWLVQKPIKDSDKLSSGSTLLNLACSGDPGWALAKGKYFWIVGDSSSGKTFLTLTTFAEASINPNFDEFDFIFDNAEEGALMNLERYFGEKMASRLQPPAMKDGVPVFSRTSEEFYYNLDDRLTLVEKGKAKPFIYLLDSMDALSTKYEGDKFKERKKAHRSGKKPTGDYGDGKAKINSTWIRGIVARLRDTDCILIILSQTRDNVGGGMFDPKKTSSGGRSLKFYASWQLWSSVGKKLKKSVKKKDRQIGIICRIAIKKNRITGKEWSVEVPIYHSYGIEDVESCVDYLIDEEHWKRNANGKINAEEFEVEMSKNQLIAYINESDLVHDLREIVAVVWREIEEACRVKRKSRF